MLEDTQLWNLFNGRFSQDYDLIVKIKIDKSKPLIPQLVADYKATSEPKEIEQAIVELTDLINCDYSQERLETLFKNLVIELYLPYFGLTHQEFLIEVLNYLENQDDKKFCNFLPKTIDMMDLKFVEETELFQLFGGRFGQDFKLFVEIDESKPLIPQLVADYKKYCQSEDLEQAIKELKQLIHQEYSEEKLEEEIFPALDINLYAPYYGLSHQKLLIEVLNCLEDQNDEDLKNSVFLPTHYEELEISQMFGIYFGQDRDLFTNIDPDKPLIPQLVASYKKDSEEVLEDIEQCILELRNLINENHSEEKLRDEIFPAIGIPGNPGYFKLTHQEFLIEVLNCLEDQNDEDLKNSVYIPKYSDTREGVLGCNSFEEIIQLEKYLSEENPYVLAEGLKLLFPNYFGKDYKDYTDIDERKGLVSQIVASYKESVPEVEVEKSIHELSRIIDKRYSEERLKNEILPRLGFELPVSVDKLGGAYQVFLELLSEKLQAKNLDY